MRRLFTSPRRGEVPLAAQPRTSFDLIGMCANYCGVIFASRMILVHLPRSECTISVMRSGEVLVASTPAFASAALEAGISSTLAAAPLSLVTMGTGVRAGNQRAYQVM